MGNFRISFICERQHGHLFTYIWFHLIWWLPVQIISTFYISNSFIGVSLSSQINVKIKWSRRFPDLQYFRKKGMENSPVCKTAQYYASCYSNKRFVLICLNNYKNVWSILWVTWLIYIVGFYDDVLITYISIWYKLIETLLFIRVSEVFACTIQQYTCTYCNEY